MGKPVTAKTMSIIEGFQESAKGANLQEVLNAFIYIAAGVLAQSPSVTREAVINSLAKVSSTLGDKIFTEREKLQEWLQGEALAEDDDES